MIDMFDTLGETINDVLGSHANNNVKYSAQQLGFASGGLADTSNDTTPTDEGPLDLDNPLSVARALGKAAKGTVIPSDSSDGSALGKLSSYNSPVFLTGHLTSLGKFFSGAEPGNLYTNRYKPPEQGKPVQSEDPENFYSRWYNRLRNFAQAKEVADSGQGTIRTK